MGMLLLTLMALTGVAAGVVVDAPAGRIQGERREIKDGGKYIMSFTGIPYALPPVGQLRFAKPMPMPRLNGTFNATKDATECIWPSLYRILGNTPQGKEDCLQLNVYAKDLKPGAKRKVVVFVHGGGYWLGSSVTQDLGSLVHAHDVVAVTMNYRLGVFGFLAAGRAAPGNWGLWDIRQSLVWIQNNIAAWGGDPDHVTLTGESAGASAVGYLAISPQTKGLFSRAWLQSGFPTSAFGKSQNPVNTMLEFAIGQGCYAGTTREDAGDDVIAPVVECLRAQPADAIAEYLGLGIDEARFVPVVDGAFLPRPPSALLADDDYLNEVGFFDRAYLVGLNNAEADVGNTLAVNTVNFMRSQPNKTEAEIEAEVEYVLRISKEFYVRNFFDAMPFTDVPAAVVDAVIDWYDRRFAGVASLVQLYTDAGFYAPGFVFTAAAARSLRTDVWLFHFNHYPKYMTGKAKGMLHGLDLSYWQDFFLAESKYALQSDFDPAVGYQPEDVRLKAALQRIVADFAKSGSPVEGTGLMWPKFDTKNAAYLDFKPQAEVRRGGFRVATARLWQHTAPCWLRHARQGLPRDRWECPVDVEEVVSSAPRPPLAALSLPAVVLTAAAALLSRAVTL